MALRDALLLGLALVVVANAAIQWRFAPAQRRRAPLLVALVLAGPMVAAASIMLIDGLVRDATTPAGYSLLAALVLTGVLVAGSIATRVPWAHAWPAPLLIFPLLFLVQFAPDPGVAYVSIFLLVGVTAPLALAGAWERRGIALWGAGLLGALLVLGMLAGTLALLLGMGEGGFGDPAVHAIHVTVEPQGEAAYTAIVPLLRAEDPAMRAPLDALLATARVIEGNATLVVVGDAIRIEGTGPATVSFERAFFGPGREAFTRWTFSDDPLRLQGAPVSVVVAFDLSGGTGHTCWMHGERSARAAPGEDGAFVGSDRPSTVCA